MLLVLLLGFFSSGCIVVKDGGQRASVDFAESAEDARERVRDRQWAETAWKQNCAANHQRLVSPDYAQGFKDGFAEHLHSGQEQLPHSAPARYRGVEYQTPQGYRAIEDWLDGYRCGIAVAIESGCRRWITGPGAPPGALLNKDSRESAEIFVTPKPLPNNAPPLSDNVRPEIGFGTPQSFGQQPPPLKEMLLPPIGVDREGDPPPRAAVPPPMLGGPQPPGSVEDDGPKE
jgi:hypothetical protein